MCEEMTRTQTPLRRAETPGAPLAGFLFLFQLSFEGVLRLWPGSGNRCRTVLHGVGLRCESWSFMELFPFWVRSSVPENPFRVGVIEQMIVVLFGIEGFRDRYELEEHRFRLRRKLASGNVINGVRLQSQGVVIDAIGKFNSRLT